jgi:hypothetical protein
LYRLIVQLLMEIEANSGRSDQIVMGPLLRLLLEGDLGVPQDLSFSLLQTHSLSPK